MFVVQMEKTVEINENSQFLEDLEMLRVVPAEHVPISVDETSPDPSQDGLGGFKFGACNPLEQLGLFMKDDEEEEEGEPLNVLNPLNEVEEGEIDWTVILCLSCWIKKQCFDLLSGKNHRLSNSEWLSGH